MKLHKVFPHRFYASDNYGWADCPPLAKMVWNRIRPIQYPDLTWYGVDYEITAPGSIRLFVYEIADNFLGGIGARILELEVTEFTDEERKVMEKDLLHLYTAKAEDELIRREARVRDMQIINIRREMFGV